MKKFAIIIIIVILLVFVLMTLSDDKTGDQSDRVTLPSLMKLTSPVFLDNRDMPVKYTCDGEDVSPPLSILEIPKKTQSLVLILDDPDAPMDSWIHWLVFNISPFISSIDENNLPSGSVLGENSFGTNVYGGPCPPLGSHHYVFKLYALDISLDLTGAAAKKDVVQAMEGHILDEAELTGLYQRQEEK